MVHGDNTNSSAEVEAHVELSDAAFVISAVTAGPDDTLLLGEQLAGLLRTGDLLVLTGDLGAGKTKLVQGLGRGLGVDEPITSPTFTLANRYETTTDVGFLHHLDVYRLNVVGEAADLDLPDLLDSGVTAIEWGGQIEAVLPAEQLTVAIEFLGTDEDEELRQLVFTGMGPRWQNRAGPIAATLARWAPKGEHRPEVSS